MTDHAKTPILKPCKKCGTDNPILINEEQSGLSWYSCSRCPHNSYAKYYTHEAAEAWNTRPEPTDAQIEAAVKVYRDAAYNGKDFNIKEIMKAALLAAGDV